MRNRCGSEGARLFRVCRLTRTKDVECFKGGRNQISKYSSRHTADKLTVVVFGIGGLIAVATIIVATASIPISTSSSIAAVTVRLTVWLVVVVLGYVLISRHD